MNELMMKVMKLGNVPWAWRCYLRCEYF